MAVAMSRDSTCMPKSNPTAVVPPPTLLGNTYLHQRSNQMAFKLTAVLGLINREHQAHDFTRKVKGSGREGYAEGCLQCCRLCSRSETADAWERNDWERWGDLNRVFWENRLASAIIFKGTSGDFLYFEHRPSLHSPCSVFF